MAANGPRIEGYCYSEGPTTGAGAALVANSTLSVTEQAHSGSPFYARPASPELFTTQLTTLNTGLDAQSPGGGTYSIAYDASTQRVTISADVSFRPAMPGAMATWLGFTQDLSSGWATSWEAESAPAGICEPLAVTAEPAEDAARVDLSEYRHGRSVATVWGNHQVHRVRVLFGRSTTLAQIRAGYLTTGRVRLWQCGEASAYDATTPGGYVDGYVVAASDPAEDGDVGELWTLDLVVAVTR